MVDWIRGKFSVTTEGNKNLAVLHNRNKMVNAFAATEWVAGSDGAVLSRSVTSCAGMTAYLVLLAQTRVGAECAKRRGLCKGDGGPHSSTADLHNHGTLGYAYGACFSGLDAQDQPVLQLRLKDEDLLEAPDVILPSCKACGSLVREWMEYIRLWPWLWGLHYRWR